jgi:signal peptidase I
MMRIVMALASDHEVDGRSRLQDAEHARGPLSTREPSRIDPAPDDIGITLAYAAAMSWTHRLPRPWRVALEWAVTIALALGFMLVFESEVAQSYRIPSASMEPTLHCARPAADCRAYFSDRVIACRLCFTLGSPDRGQIVVFTAPPSAARACGEGGTYVKRLIGLPGDTIREDRASRLWIDGRPLSEPYISAAARAADTGFRGESWRVPAGEYFMLGDSRGDSCDSRTWGAVPRGNLIGPVVATYWPPTRIGLP